MLPYDFHDLVLEQMFFLKYDVCSSHRILVVKSNLLCFFNPLLEQEVVPKRIVDMEEAIKNRDFPSFARLACSDSNQFHAVCLDTSPPIFYMNDTSHRHVIFTFPPLQLWLAG